MTEPSTTSVEKPLALVTGASTGIGLALAREFADHGFDLVLVADEDAVVSAAQELSAQGVSTKAVQADLAVVSGVEAVLEALEEAGRPVAAAALNAGVGAYGRFHETPEHDDLRVIGLNVTSSVLLAKRLLRHMVARGEGRLLFTSSIAATMPGPLYATYAASKAFVHSFAEAVREELADTGVTVTSMLPGPTDTEFFHRAGMERTRVASGDKDDAAEVAREGFEAMMAGKDKVVTGSAKNRVMSGAAGVLPDRVKAKVHGSMTRPTDA